MPFNIDLIKEKLTTAYIGDKGFCIFITSQTTQFLINGPNTKLASIDQTKTTLGFDIYSEQEMFKDCYANRIKFPTALAVFEHFQKAESGDVFIVATGGDDHFYNIVKTDDNHFFLIDTDLKIFKEIFSLADFKFSDSKQVDATNRLFKIIQKRGSYDYLSCDLGEALTVYKAGKIHPEFVLKKTLDQQFQS